MSHHMWTKEALAATLDESKRRLDAQTFDVMIECPTGTWTLRDGPLRWESGMHTITWTTCATEQEANDVVADIHAGQMRGVHAWVKRHGER